MHPITPWTSLVSLPAVPHPYPGPLADSTTPPQDYDLSQLQQPEAMEHVLSTLPQL